MSKCCFLEYKDKGNNNKKRRDCFIVSYNQFLDIKQTIKDLKNYINNFIKSFNFY